MTDEPGGDRLGSVAEEAAKLLAAFQDWAREPGGRQAAASAASGVAAGLRDLDAHVATGGESCRYCPVCRLIDTVRGVSPEVRGHLAAAATSLLQAAAGAMATQVPEPERAGTGEETWEGIDLTDEPEDPVDPG